MKKLNTEVAEKPAEEQTAEQQPKKKPGTKKVRWRDPNNGEMKS